MLIQDDFGLQPLDNGSRMHLMDIIKDRYGKKTTLITSQLPLPDPVWLPPQALSASG